MKKLRGKRKYFNKLQNSKPYEWINFSSDNDSWFDLFHHHIDNLGMSNDSWKCRKQHLDALFSLAEKYKSELKNYKKEFQFWILIDETDSFDDAIYLHTENPNKSEFPIEIEESKDIVIKNKLLSDYLNEKNMKLSN